MWKAGAICVLFNRWFTSGILNKSIVSESRKVPCDDLCGENVYTPVYKKVDISNIDIYLLFLWAKQKKKQKVYIFLKCQPFCKRVYIYLIIYHPFIAQLEEHEVIMHALNEYIRFG